MAGSMTYNPVSLPNTPTLSADCLPALFSPPVGKKTKKKKTKCVLGSYTQQSIKNSSHFADTVFNRDS